MNENQLLRYSRHILLNEFDVEGQEALQNATVLVVGCGGLGNACVPILAGAGVGNIIVCDDDTVELSNLQRQFAFTVDSIGASKAEQLRAYALARNPEIRIKALCERVDSDVLLTLLPHCDVVVDCSDNSSTRHLVNQCAVHMRTPLISASVIQFSGQLMVFDSRQTNSPCYACVFPKPVVSENSCTKNGVFSPLVHIIGAAQAAEVIKHLSGMGSSSVGKMVQFEGLDFASFAFDVAPNLDCPVCQRRPRQWS